MRLRKRVETVAVAVAGGCPGPGVVNRLSAEDAPDPPACPVCGGCHVLVIEEVVVSVREPPVDPPGP